MIVRPTPDAAAAATPAVAAPGVRAGSTEGRPTRTASRPAPASPSGDRLELSAAATQAEASRASRAGGDPEVEAARVALRSGGGLGAERLHELRERVRTGHYDQPAAIDRIAEAALTDALTDDAAAA